MEPRAPSYWILRTTSTCIAELQKINESVWSSSFRFFGEAQLKRSDFSETGHRRCPVTHTNGSESFALDDAAPLLK
jgi:hypothetical protein